MFPHHNRKGRSELFENPYGYSNYMIRKQFFKLFGETFRIYTPTGALAFYANLKAFKLKEDIRVYSDESRTREILAIKARNIIDIAATYDVIDSMSGQKIGAFKRKGLKSIIKDEWLIFDAQDQQIGMIQEDSWKLALLRRYNKLNTSKIPRHCKRSACIHFPTAFQPDYPENRPGLFD